MYKRVDVDNLKEIQQELLDYNFYSKKPDVDTEDSPLQENSVSGALFLKIPDLPKLNKFLNDILHTEYITHFHVINIIGHSQSNVHLDLDNSPWALNIPIKNCSNSSTIFYATDKQTEIGRTTLDVPYFLKVGDLYHQVVNHSNNSRLVMSIRFIGKDLQEILKA